MADLRELYESLGFKQVQSYIQSGNVIFESDLSAEQCEVYVRQAINERYGFEVPTTIVTSEFWQRLVTENPFLKRDANIPIERLYVTLLGEKPATEHIRKLEAFDFGEDRWRLDERCIYLCYQTRLSDSKLDNNRLERLLKVSATTRNWKTTLKLYEIVTASE